MFCKSKFHEQNNMSYVIINDFQDMVTFIYMFDKCYAVVNM